MEASSALLSVPNNPPAGDGGGASKFLADLPSRGLFSSTVFSPNPGGMRVYICDHNTSPSENQVIKTNSMNILIRSLMLKKHKGDCSTKEVKSAAGNVGARKRAAERDLDGRASAKRAVTSTHAGTWQEGSKYCASEKDLHSMTVEKLRGLLRERGLSMKGKKDELIARLRVQMAKLNL